MTEFSGDARAYARGRPGYPRGLVVAAVGNLPPKSRVADVGAGTGKLSAALAAAGMLPISVEPDAEMRAEFELPSTPTIGTAERTGLGNDSVAAVVSGQALHYFDLPRALGEFQRISPSGSFTNFYNFPDTDNWFGKLWTSVRDLTGRPHHSAGRTVSAVESLLGPSTSVLRQKHVHPLSVDDFVAFFRSLSAVQAMEPLIKLNLLDRARQEALTHVHNSGGDVEVTYECYAYTWALGSARA